MYDIIGDVHGHADELKALLAKLGYENNGYSFEHADRKVIFVGDYIDRGPNIRDTLYIVKAMVDTGNAIALMGNHEYNAICYHTRGNNGKPLRAHSEKNIDQHKKTIEQFAGNEEQLQSYIEWFKTLPLFYEGEDFRVVHACWNSNHIRFLNKSLSGNLLTDDALLEAHNGNTALFNALEITLKGEELRLPDDRTFIDKDGHKRNEIRIKWWLKPNGLTYKELSVIEDSGLPITNAHSNDGGPYYGETEVPVFFGHYWLPPDPFLYRSNICCLDYSVAKGGKLVAYKFRSGKSLETGDFVF